MSCDACREEHGGQTASSDGLEQPQVDTVESLYQQLEKEKEEQRRLLQEQLEKEKEEQRRLLQEQLEREKEEQRKMLMEQLEKEKEEQRRKLQEQKEVRACSLSCVAECLTSAIFVLRFVASGLLMTRTMTVEICRALVVTE